MISVASAARALVGFPDPVDEVAARVVASGVVAMAATSIVCDAPWLLAPLTYGFAARVLTGPKLSPLGQLATRVVAPRIPGAHPTAPGPPKRLAQGIGLALTSSAAILRLGFGKRASANALLATLVMAAGLEAGFGYCLACKMFPLLARTGLVRPDACEDCADISRRRGR